MDHYRVIYENNLLLRNEYDYENGKTNFKDYKLFWWGFGVFINDLIYTFL